MNDARFVLILTAYNVQIFIVLRQALKTIISCEHWRLYHVGRRIEKAKIKVEKIA